MRRNEVKTKALTNGAIWLEDLGCGLGTGWKLIQVVPGMLNDVYVLDFVNGPRFLSLK